MTDWITSSIIFFILILVGVLFYLLFYFCSLHILFVLFFNFSWFYDKLGPIQFFFLILLSKIQEQNWTRLNKYDSWNPIIFLIVCENNKTWHQIFIASKEWKQKQEMAGVPSRYGLQHLSRCSISSICRKPKTQKQVPNMHLFFFIFKSIFVVHLNPFLLHAWHMQICQ